MEPEQLRAARAALHWSLERLAEASGVHRNTISNFETRRYLGEPEKLAALKRTLEDAGVIFDQSGDAASVSLRRFQRGDLVRFRSQTRVRFDYGIAADDIGKVVEVEPHPPATGPTYRIQVQFERALVPYAFRFEYELVQAAPTIALAQSLAPTPPPDPKVIMDAFCVVCTGARRKYDLYRSLFESDSSNLDLFDSIAPLCFGDVWRILADNVFLQFCKITDPAGTGSKTNLTTNYILEIINWPDAVAKELREVNERLNTFRRYIEPARSKRIAHVDVSSQIVQLENLGKFPKGADLQFLQDLQTFINIAYGHLHNGDHRPIIEAMSSDTHQLIRALEKSIVFDQCSKCSAGERAAAVLDREDRPKKTYQTRA